MILASLLTFCSGESVFKPLNFSPQIVSSAFTANRTLFAGDTGYTLYRSDDNGISFRQIFTFPSQFTPVGQVAGFVMTLFVDSRDFVFVSIPGTNRLYRSVDFGVSFVEVLNSNGTVNDGFYIAVAEDSVGSLYAATYVNSLAVQGNWPSILKSADSGATWFKILEVHAVHFHSVKFNPANGYLYAVSGEWAQGLDSGQSEQVFRSKDFGQTWKAVILRSASSQTYGDTIYLPMYFAGSWVYLGSDQAYKPNWIDRFYDNGSDVAFMPERVYSLPESDGNMPFISAVGFNDSMLFSSTAEFTNGTVRIVASRDGGTWTTVKTANYTTTQHHANKLTDNPSGILFGSDGFNANFAFYAQEEPPAPTPTVTPDAVPTPTPAPSQTTLPTPTPAPAPTPKPTTSSTPKPTPLPTSNSTPTATPASTSQGKVDGGGFGMYPELAASILIGTTVAASGLMIVRKHKFRKNSH